jgi:hypothetical protein
MANSKSNKSDAVGTEPAPVDPDGLGGRTRLSRPPAGSAATAKVIFRLGGGNADLANALNVDLDTVSLWQSIDHEFAQACRLEEDPSKARIFRALIQAAQGYSCDDYKVISRKEGVTLVRRKVHVRPNASAAKLVLEFLKEQEESAGRGALDSLYRQLVGTAIRPKEPK